jgi:hypothetical protein
MKVTMNENCNIKKHTYLKVPAHFLVITDRYLFNTRTFCSKMHGKYTPHYMFKIKSQAGNSCYI